MLRDRCPVCLSYVYVTLVYCGQTVGWIKMPLDTELGLSPGGIELGGDPALLHWKGHSSPSPFFGPLCSGTVAHLSNCWALVGLSDTEEAAYCRLQGSFWPVLAMSDARFCWKNNGVHFHTIYHVTQWYNLSKLHVNYVKSIYYKLVFVLKLASTMRCYWRQSTPCIFSSRTN